MNNNNDGNPLDAYESLSLSLNHNEEQEPFQERRVFNASDETSLSTDLLNVRNNSVDENIFEVSLFTLNDNYLESVVAVMLLAVYTFTIAGLLASVHGCQFMPVFPLTCTN